MDNIRLLLTLFPLALASGINLYAAILVTGLSIRMEWIHNAPAGLEIFASTPVLIITSILYLIEFFADKIQIVDTIWDTIHTIVRPLGIAILTLAAVFEFDPFLAVLASLAAGSVSLVSHTAKSGTRFSLNTISPLENVKNVGISIVEDIFVVGFSFLALKYPYLLAAITFILLILLLLFLPVLFRWFLFMLSAIFARLTSLFAVKEENDFLKGEYLALINYKKIVVCTKCKSKGVPKAKGKVGYLILLSDSLNFVYPKFFGIFKKIWQIQVGAVKAIHFRKRLLVDLLEVHYVSEKNKPRICRFIALKNRALLFKRIEDIIKSNDIASKEVK